jgi:cell division protein FtsA
MTILTCAIQLGSSRILAAAAQKELPKGTLTNIQIESEASTDCISHGRIVNIEKTAMHIRALIQKLSNRMRTPISAAYVGLGGMSLHSLIQQPSVKIPDYDVLASQSIGPNQYQLIVGEKRISESIKAAMDRAGIRIVDIVVLPLATASILKNTERQKGCVLVDMGAATTTVAIYKGGDLRHLAVIPLGGESVTYDIQSAGCSYEDAERIKRDWSDVSQEVTPESPATNTPSAMFAEKALPIPQSKLNNIALCRYEEIAANIEHQIEASGLKDQLEAGCILTGGAAYQNGITALLLRRLSMAHIETRAYRESAQIGSDRKLHLTNLLSLLSSCTADCQAPKVVAPEPRPAVQTRVQTPVQPIPVDVNEPSLDIPDREPENETEVENEPVVETVFETDLESETEEPAIEPQTQTESGTGTQSQTATEPQSNDTTEPKAADEEVKTSSSLGEAFGRFWKDLFTGQ